MDVSSTGASGALAIALATALAAVAPMPVVRAQTPPARVPDIHFTPTRQVIAEAMLALAGTGPGDLVVDLGSGDGRLVVLAAQLHGARGVGIEIQPPLVRDADLSSATVVVLYLSTTLTREITPKLRRELRPGARIVSQQFQLHEWPPDRSVTVEGQTLYLWTVPPR